MFHMWSFYHTKIHKLYNLCIFVNLKIIINLFMDCYVSPEMYVLNIDPGGIMCTSTNLDDPIENPEIDW